MAWTKSKNLFFIFVISLVCIVNANAQESLWKTFNPHPDREVPAYSGGLSPFPQKQENIEEIQFGQLEDSVTNISNLEADDSLSENEKRLMLTTSILAEIKAFLSEESVFIPNLDSIVVEATAKANGKYRALIKGRWREAGDTLNVPVDEAVGALDLLGRLRDVDEQIANTVEEAVLVRTKGISNEVIKVTEILEDRVVFQGANTETYVVNFIKAPY